MRARMGYRRSALHRSTLLCDDRYNMQLHPRYVVRLDGFYVCEWGYGQWCDYSAHALKRARRVLKKHATQVQVSPSPTRLTQIAPNEIDTRVMHSIEAHLISYWANRGCRAVPGGSYG